jgi:hypothetical protein
VRQFSGHGAHPPYGWCEQRPTPNIGHRVDGVDCALPALAMIASRAALTCLCMTTSRRLARCCRAFQVASKPTTSQQMERRRFIKFVNLLPANLSALFRVRKRTRA